MKQEMTFYELSRVFEQSDTYKNSYTYQGLKAIYDHLEDPERQGDEYVFEGIDEFRMDFYEYGSLKDAYEDIEGKEGDGEDPDYMKGILESDYGHTIIPIPDSEPRDKLLTAWAGSAV